MNRQIVIINNFLFPLSREHNCLGAPFVSKLKNYHDILNKSLFIK